MSHKFKKGDHVKWNSEFGHVVGKVVKIYTSDFDFKGQTHRPDKDDPLYEVKSDKTDHTAIHKGSALSLNKS